MDIAHIHLVLTHLPILGTLFGLLVLVYAMFRGNADVMVVSLWTFVLSGIAAAATYLTGEGAEEIVERLPGVSENLIEAHSDFAAYTLVASVFLGIVALGGLWVFGRRKMIPAWIGRTVLVVSLLVSGMMIWTANLGGRINHPEIRPGANTQVESSRLPQESGNRNDDD